MLSASRPSSHRKVLTAALRPTIRALPWGLVVAILALAVLPMTTTLLRGGDALGGALVFAVVVGAAVIAIAVEDDAAELLASTPPPLAWRRSARALLLGAGVLAVLTAAVLVGRGRDGTVDDHLAARATEALAVAGASVAVASWAAARRIGLAGPTGALAGSMVVLVIAALAQRFPALPTLGEDRHHERWWFVASLAWAVVAVTWRDPAARRPVRWRG